MAHEIKIIYAEDFYEDIREIVLYGVSHFEYREVVEYTDAIFTNIENRLSSSVLHGSQKATLDGKELNLLFLPKEDVWLVWEDMNNVVRKVLRAIPAKKFRLL